MNSMVFIKRRARKKQKQREKDLEEIEMITSVFKGKEYFKVSGVREIDDLLDIFYDDMARYREEKEVYERLIEALDTELDMVASLTLSIRWNEKDENYYTLKEIGRAHV